jgi:uncharacterized membrane protein
MNNKAVTGAYIATLLSLLALIVLSLAWELWLAPLRPGGSWLVLKALPLLGPLRGILAGKRYTYKWSSLLALAYFTEGTVRAATDHGVSQRLAVAEVVLSVALYASAILYVRATRPPVADLGANVSAED